jgi:hypothetical protein
MKAVSYFGQLDKLSGVPVTTRNWNTIQSIAKALVCWPRTSKRVANCRLCNALFSAGLNVRQSSVFLAR